jgi:WD40 repeat protein
LVAGLLFALSACGPERAPSTHSVAPSVISTGDAGATSGSAAPSATAPSATPLPAANAAWSRSGALVAAGNFIVDLSAGRRIQTHCGVPDASSVGRPLWGGDDAVACNRSEGVVEVHDLASGKENELGGAAIAWDFSGRYLLVRRAAAIVVYDRISDSSTEAPSGFDRVEWLAHGTLLRLGHLSNDSALLWDAAAKAAVGAPIKAEAGLSSLSPSGAYVLDFAYEDAPNGKRAALEAFLVDGMTGDRHQLAKGVSAIEGTPDQLRFFSPDSTKVVVPMAKSGIKLFDVKTLAPLGVLVARGCETPLQIAWSQKGDLVATGSDSSHICVFEAASRRLRRSWEVPLHRHTDSRPTPNILLLAFCAADKGIVAGNFDGEGYSVSVWEMPAGKEVDPRGAYGTLDGVRITTRGDALLGTARVDMNLGFHDSMIPEWRGVADISAEGRYVVTASDDDASNGLHSDGVALPVFQHGEGATFVSMSPDGSRVLGYVDGRPRVWDLQTGNQVFP